MSLFSMISRWNNLLLVMLPLLAVAQQEESERSAAIRQSQFVNFEAIPVFTADTGNAVAHIHYRIRQNFFVFVKNEHEKGPDRFVANGELLVELLDEQKNSVAREVRQINLRRTSIPQADENLADLQGVVVFSVPDGRYTVLFRVDDRESGRSFLNRDRQLATRRPVLGSFEISFPFLGQIVVPEDKTKPVGIFPFNLGGGYPFGSGGGFVLQLSTPGSTRPISLEWNLKRERPLERSSANMGSFLTPNAEGDLIAAALEDQALSGNQFTLVDGYFNLHASDSGISYDAQNGSTGWKILFIPLPLEQLAPWPRYRLDLKIISDAGAKEQTYYFGSFWQKKPRSLLDPNLAIDALKHIATDQELEDIQAGSFAKSAKAFFQFWRTRDPDTTTVYNEVMEEYYRRVDRANERFSSVREQDGYKTDRGRIFILFGPPTRTNRVLGTDSTLIEVWIFENVGRRFTFMDRGRTGNFILAKVEDL